MVTLTGMFVVFLILLALRVIFEAAIALINLVENTKHLNKLSK
jgi:hypothetical protein